MGIMFDDCSVCRLLVSIVIEGLAPEQNVQARDCLSSLALLARKLAVGHSTPYIRLQG